MKFFNQTTRRRPELEPIRKNRLIIKSSNKVNYGLIEDLSSYEISQLRIGYSSTWKVSCGIAVYTEHLYNALRYQNACVFAYPNTLSPDNLLLQIDRDKIHVLNIQYEPAITYNFLAMCYLFRELKKRNIKIVLTFHSEDTNVHNLISMADQAIFHKTPSFDYKDIINKINIIKMGVPVFDPFTSRENLRDFYGFSKDALILSTTGFMFSWKKHAVILDKLAPFVKSNPNINVQLLTAFNSVNPAECELEQKNIQNVIQSHSLQNQVIHLTSFLPQKELSERLYISDIGYLWGAITTTSSSAASKEFISSRLPLVVTESNHYHDLNKGIIRTPIDKDIFVNTILSLTPEKISLLRDQQESNYQIMNNNNMILKHIEVFKK